MLYKLPYGTEPIEGRNFNMRGCKRMDLIYCSNIILEGHVQGHSSVQVLIANLTLSHSPSLSRH